MKRMLMLAVCLAIGQGIAAAERAAVPGDATVFIRLVGSVHAEIDDPGTGRQTVDQDRVEIGTGSGFVISPAGYILTNEHVIGNTELTLTNGVKKGKVTLKVARIEACFPAAAGARSDSPRCYNASVHSSDPALDLAVLFIVASDLPYVALGDSDAVRSGQSVSALGYPFGRDLEVGRVAAPDLVPQISTSPGAISALRGDDNGERRVVQINSTVNPGNSGGPVVDQDGFAVGVIRARVKGDAGIGFAIPINQAKDFLESHGLDALMPARRLRLGPPQTLEGKGVSLRLPAGLTDKSPFRSHIESDVDAAPVALRIDRAVSPWTDKEIENALTRSESFESLSFAASESQTTKRAGSAPILLGRASGAAAGADADVRMQYGILQLGPEKLVARYVGSAEQIAYNESVLHDSLLSLEGQRLTAEDQENTDQVQWSADTPLTAALKVPVPAGWVVEPASPSICTGLPQPSAVAAAYPVQDVTFALRAAVWDTATVVPREAAAACSSSRGAAGSESYALRVDFLGVAYSMEGVFLRVGPTRVVQLEVISPARKSALARGLLTAWIERANRP